jgi:hypothetical protein
MAQGWRLRIARGRQYALIERRDVRPSLGSQRADTTTFTGVSLERRRPAAHLNEHLRRLNLDELPEFEEALKLVLSELLMR